MIVDTDCRDTANGMLEWFARRTPSGRPGAFIDRDGVINEHISGGYVVRSDDFRWLPGAAASLRRLCENGYDVFVVTNQSCINRGLLRVETLTSIMNDLVAALDAAGAACVGWLCCPHRPDQGCACRKPGTAMLERAAAVTGVELSRSVLIGDSDTDVAAAQAVGMRGLLVERNSQAGLSAAVDAVIGGAR